MCGNLVCPYRAFVANLSGQRSSWLMLAPAWMHRSAASRYCGSLKPLSAVLKAECYARLLRQQISTASDKLRQIRDGLVSPSLHSVPVHV